MARRPWLVGGGLSTVRIPSCALQPMRHLEAPSLCVSEQPSSTCEVAPKALQLYLDSRI